MSFKHKQRGGLVPLIAAAVAGTALLSSLAFNYFSIARSSSNVSLMTQSGDLLTQAAYTLAAEGSDSDADGFTESTAGTVVRGDGWDVPATSGAPKSDSWGTAMKYCPWNNGATNVSAGRLNGDNPGTQSSVVFAIVSAGPDKNIDTTCANAKTGAATGDDGVRIKTQAQISQGVGGTIYWGDPVATDAALAALSTVGMPAGHQRLVLGTNVIKRWTGAAWTVVSNPDWTTTAGVLGNTNASGITTTGLLTSNGNLRFGSASATITASDNSYITIPYGLYLNSTSGYTYFKGRAMFRDGIANDGAATLQIYGGTGSATQVNGTLAVSGATSLTSATMTGNIGRVGAATGYLDGKYAAGGESSLTSGAIYTIGGSYLPTTTTLGTMYGVGYGVSGTAGIGAGITGLPASQWGFYTAANGASYVFLDAINGRVYAQGGFTGNGNSTIGGTLSVGSTLTASALTVSNDASVSALQIRQNNVTSGGACATSGQLARDAAGDLYICK